MMDPTRESAPLPFITPDLPGLGGEIKSEPGHFVVEELPLYEPGGQGDHLYVRLTREGWTTRRLTRALAELFGLREVDVGCAGQKDKQARATQTVSLLLPGLDEKEAAARIEAALPVEVLSARRHGNKLRTGHLLGNRFTVLVVRPSDDALGRAEAVHAALAERGLPNYYGLQRFGVDGDNAGRGREALVKGGPRQRWLRRFLLSAFQSRLFNAWLAERIQRDWFGRLLDGDLAKKTDTGGLFLVEDAGVEAPRFEAGAITYTGPIYGTKMRWPDGLPGELERAILEAEGVTRDMLARARLEGSRRAARIQPDGLRVSPDPQGLLFEFSLPKGAYATTVLREFMKVEPALPEDDDG